MPITIGINIASIQAQRQLGKTSEALSQTYERLASGMRINRASDDAAGLAIADSLRASTRVYTQGIRNLNDGVSALTIAQGGLDQLSIILTRQQELAEQAANGTYTTTQRAAMQRESDALVEEYNRIAQVTSFNGIGLLNGGFRSTSLQAGFGINESLAIDVGGFFSRTVGDGTLQTKITQALASTGQSTAAGDLNRDGLADLVVAANGGNTYALLSNGDGSFRISQAYNGLGSTTVLADINGDTILDIAQNNYTGGTFTVALGNGNGTFKHYTTSWTAASLTYMSFEDFNEDGFLDAFTRDGTSVRISFGNGDGSFAAPTTILANTAGSTQDALGDINNDGNVDLVLADTSNAIRIAFGNGNGTFRAPLSIATGASPWTVTIGDYNRDGYLDIASNDPTSRLSIQLGNGDGTFKYAGSFYGGASLGHFHVATDINEDGLLDLVVDNYTNGTAAFLIGNGDGSFKAPRQFAMPNTTSTFGVGDFNNDGVLDIAIGDSTSNSIVIGCLRPVTVYTMPYLTLTTQASARASLETAKQLVDAISAEKGNIGALQSRVQSSIGFLSNVRDNYISAESRIRDVDVAEETSNLIRTKTLQEVAAAVLAHAQIQPDLALKLLDI